MVPQRGRVQGKVTAVQVKGGPEAIAVQNFDHPDVLADAVVVAEGQGLPAEAGPADIIAVIIGVHGRTSWCRALDGPFFP